MDGDATYECCKDVNALKFGRSGWKRKKRWSGKRKRSHQLGTAEMFEEGDVSLESYGREWKRKPVEFDSEMFSWIKNRRENVRLLGPRKIKVFEDEGEKPVKENELVLVRTNPLKEQWEKSAKNLDVWKAIEGNGRKNLWNSIVKC
jgi:hypothetical protein